MNHILHHSNLEWNTSTNLSQLLSLGLIKVLGNPLLYNYWKITLTQNSYLLLFKILKKLSNNAHNLLITLTKGRWYWKTWILWVIQVFKALSNKLVTKNGSSMLLWIMPQWDLIKGPKFQISNGQENLWRLTFMVRFFVNLGTIKFTNSLLPYLNKNGRIVNVSSRFAALRNHP